jgi:acyl-coenzyme A synthetase/AMP-(fatty) acid ligase
MQADASPKLLRDWIDRAAARDPDKPWIVCADDGRTVTYGELRKAIGQIAAFLRDRGIGTNDRIALLANNSIEHLLCYVGVIAYGATICTVHVEMNRRHLDNILPALDPRLVLFEPDAGVDDLVDTVPVPHFPFGAWDDRRGDSLFAAVNACEPSNAFAPTTQSCDDAMIVFTSGTTARPKGVVLTFRELLSNAPATAQGFGYTANDRIYDFRSFNWCSAPTLSATAPISCGATLVLARKFSRSRFFEHVREHGATITAGNPTTINMLLNGDDPLHAGDVPSLRFIISSSAPLLVEEWRRFEDRFGIRVSQGYGASEIGWIAAHPGEGRRIGTVGRPLPYHRLSIAAAGGAQAGPGEIGMVELGGFAEVHYRYLADDGSIQVASQGRTITGDLGFLDDEGFLHLVGREKELIIRGGVNISPVEIDSFLMLRPELIEVATVGVPDAIYGEEVVSYVVARPGATNDESEILSY